MRAIVAIAVLIFAAELGAAALSYRRHQAKVQPMLQQLGVRPAPAPEPVLLRDLPTGARISSARPPGGEIPTRMIYFMRPSTNPEYYGADGVSEERVKADNAREAREQRQSMQDWDRIPH